jgi:hypothetical protein
VSRVLGTTVALLSLAAALGLGSLSGYLLVQWRQPPPDRAPTATATLGVTPQPSEAPAGDADATPAARMPTAVPPTVEAPTPTSTEVVPTITPAPTPTFTILESGPGPMNLIIVIWDGTQRAHLLEMLADGQLPSLAALINETGRLVLPTIDSELCAPGSGDGYLTMTGPANSAIATGLGYPGMANWLNTEPHPIPDGLTLWEWFDARGYATGIVSSKDWDFWPNTPLTNARPEIDYWKVAKEPQPWVTDNALAFIQAHAGERFFLWIHYMDPDEVGHAKGENSAEYSESLVVDDQELGRLRDELSRQGLQEATLLIVTTDHGFEEGGVRHKACNADTKGLFLAATENGSSLLGCINFQTDIAPCLKGTGER